MIRDGRSKHPYYSNYEAMMRRCYDPKKHNYDRYGGRGIKVCNRWKDPKMGFWNFVKDMGRRPHPSWTIDRIRTDLGYSPKNCQWSNPRTQVIRAKGGFTDNTNITKTPAGHYRVVIWKAKKIVDKTLVTKKEAIEYRNKCYKRFKLTYQNPYRNRNYKKFKEES